MVPKHRRSEFEQSLAMLGAPVTGEYWPEAVGYGTATATAPHAMAAPGGNGYPASNGYDESFEPGWAQGPEERSWQEWYDWQDLGPPPEMHPDHPSAPVPRIQLPADHPSRPMPAVRAPQPPELPRRRPGGSGRERNAPPQRPAADYDRGNRRLHVVPNGASGADYAPTALRPPENPGRQYPGQTATDLAGPDWRETNGFQRQQAPAAPEVSHFQRQAVPDWQEPAAYRRETDPYAPGAAAPGTGQHQNGPAPNGDTLWMAGQVLTLAGDRAAEIAQEAEGYAAAIREAAQRDATALAQQAASRADAITQEAAKRADAITHEAAARLEAAERETAELRARLDLMSGELHRVAAYVIENLAAPAMPATAPAMPPTAAPAMPPTFPAMPQTFPAMPQSAPATPPVAPDLPDARPAPSRTRTAPPDTRPGRPDTRPGTKPAGPARPKTTPTKKPQTQGRQLKAMRIATAGTAALLSVAVVAGISEIGLRGFPFFVFRATATGESGPQAPTDQQFLAAEHHHAATTKPAAAPKGRHHKKALEVHHT